MRKTVLIQSILAFLFVLPAIGQIDTIDNQLDATDTLDQNFGLFTHDEILNLSLSFDITTYQRKKPKDEYMDALLTYHTNNNDTVNRHIRIKTRGEMRNGYCSYPPIRLNFKDGEFEKDDVKKIKKIKMVTHCQHGNENYLLKEYLVYKLFNVLTDTSFRVRLMKVEYINTNDKKKKDKSVHSFAFLIEPVELLAERINATEISLTNLTQKHVYPQIMDRMAIFNYMIGNTDWSIPNQHNCKILTSKNFNNNTLGIAIPYDFDYCGLVDADYAVPYEPLGLESVRERRYVGICRTAETYNEALKEFSTKKDDFYKVINDFSLLSEKERKSMIDYLDSFFRGIDKQQTVVNDILSGCNDF